MACGRDVPKELNRKAGDVMTEDSTEVAGAPSAEADEHDRIFLCVVDSSDEMRIALRFACRRANHTGGRVALLFVIEPADFQHWMSVEEKMREERREEAERVLQNLAAQVNHVAGVMPALMCGKALPMMKS